MQCVYKVKHVMACSLKFTMSLLVICPKKKYTSEAFFNLFLINYDLALSITGFLKDYHIKLLKILR